MQASVSSLASSRSENLTANANAMDSINDFDIVRHYARLLSGDEVCSALFSLDVYHVRKEAHTGRCLHSPSIAYSNASGCDISSQRSDSKIDVYVFQLYCTSLLKLIHKTTRSEYDDRTHL